MALWASGGLRPSAVQPVLDDRSPGRAALLGHDHQPSHGRQEHPGATGLPPVAREVVTAPGHPLDQATRGYMEPRFGWDFSQVRVHTDAQAARSAQAVGARAYTVGQHVVFGPGQPSPAAPAARQVLAHELAHVVQQGRGGPGSPAPDIGLAAPHEQDAHAAAMAIAAGRPQARVATSTGVGLAGDWEEVQHIASVAADHLETVGSAVNNTSSLAEIEDELHTRAPSDATARELLGHLDGAWDLPARNRQLQEALRAAGEHLERKGLGGWIESNRRRRLGSIVERLERIADRDDQARRLLNGLQRARGEVERLEEVRRAQAGTLAYSAESSADKATQRAKKPTTQSKGARTEAKRVGTEAEAATGTEVKTVGTEATASGGPAEGGPVKATQTAEAVTGAGGEVTVPSGRWKSALQGFRQGVEDAVSAESIAAEIPMVILSVADKFAAREAIRRIQVTFSKEGFAKGVAAGVMRWSEEEVRLNLMNRITPNRVRGFEDPAGLLSLPYILQLAEAYENQAVHLGYQFSSSRTPEWKNEIRGKGFAILAKQGYHFGEDKALFEFGFIDKLAGTINTITNPIVDEAIEKGDERRRAQEAEKRRFESGHGEMRP